MPVVDDEPLRQAARQEVAREDQARIHELLDERSTAGLAPPAAAELERLLSGADRILLVRAHAARLLHERGHDVSDLAS